MGNGLMQTLAFFTSKGKPYHLRLCEDICEWLTERFKIPPENSGRRNLGSFGAVMAFLHASEPVQYRRATDEAMELLRWIRQFASAVTG
jgi:CRISPR-associated protein Cmr5